MEYVKDGKGGWIPVVRRRKKSARSEDGDDSGNLNIKLNLIEVRIVVWQRKANGIPGVYICGSLQASRWVAVKPSPISSRTKVK